MVHGNNWLPPHNRYIQGGDLAALIYTAAPSNSRQAVHMGQNHQLSPPEVPHDH